jgi:1-acyl-sn-glycerol-3-phosphate acyltransferase
LAVARFGARCILFGFGIFYIGMKGTFDEAARFAIANHVGLLDSILIMIFHDFSCPIDIQYRSIQAIQLLLECMNPVYVNYEQSSHYCRAKIIESADSSSRPPILLFPEGTSSRGCGDVLMGFDQTAFSTPYKVQPIVLKYHMIGVPRNWNTYAYRGEGLGATIWRLVSMPPSVASVSFLPSMSLGCEGKAEIETFVTVAQLSMANSIGIQAVDRH